MSVEEKLAKYSDLLTFEETPEYTVIRLKEYVPKPKWDEINTAIVGLGGEYIGGIGKEVHWRKPKETQLNIIGTVRQAIELLVKAEKELERKNPK